ncbi:MAG: hypothetical protein DMG51_06470 [Acidobacteria bacterium]|nr:MAG: hypothetical protein DMG51_06470 [Acidobacteriota bacterium]
MVTPLTWPSTTDKGDRVLPHGDHATSEDTVLPIHRDNGSILDQEVETDCLLLSLRVLANRK